MAQQNIGRKSGFGLLLAFALMSAAPPSANGAMAVFDSAALTKLAEQVTNLTKQLEELKAVNDFLQDQLDAIGEMGQITLPSLDLAKLGKRLKEDMECLKPDFSKLMPNVDFEDIEWDSICDGGRAYRDSLFISKDDYELLPDWEAKRDARREIEERRDRIHEDAATKALAQADIATADVEKTKDAADELEQSANAAKTQNQRLAVIAKGQAALIKAQAQTNQILATLLKVQAITAIKMGVEFDSDLVQELKEQGVKEQGGGS